MYLKLINNVPVKYSLNQLRRDNPRTSFPNNITQQMLESFNVYPYTRPEVPEVDNLCYNVTDGEFLQDGDGNWILPYITSPIPEQQAAFNIRQRRDSMLAETDWLVIRSIETQIPLDSNMQAYRQALRDITSQSGFPYSVEWPTKPQ